MNVLTLILAVVLEIIPAGETYLKALQQRDSALIADQFEYGFELGDLKEGDALSLQDVSGIFNDDTLVLVRNWQIDTLHREKKRGPRKLRASVVLSPFEAGEYELPPLFALLDREGRSDTLMFESQKLEVFTMPVDTATFEIKPLKDQIKYPLTFREVFPWVAGGLAFAAVAVLLVLWIVRRRARRGGEEAQRDPAYIVALRELEKFRGEKFLAPEKQKHFYSGITDALRNYMEDRYGIDAPEMTSSEVLSSLKNEDSITPALFGDLKDLLETADFVKFAKHVVSVEEAAKALPFAIRFVMDTYKAEGEEAPEQN